MSDTEETWEQRHEREQREWEEKNARLWAKYKDRKDGKKEKLARAGGGTAEYDITFHDWTKETDDEVRTKTTMFRFDKKGKLIGAWSSTTKSQRFLAVNGPLAGKVVTVEEAGDPYWTYNCAAYGRSGDRAAPKVILVHESAFK